MHFVLPPSIIQLLLRKQSQQAHPEIKRFSEHLKTGFSKREKDALEGLVEMRRQLATDESSIIFEDFGLSQSNDLDPSPIEKSRKIKEIYLRASIPKTWSEFLFSLVRFFKPNEVLEIGTNIGVGAAYIQRALDLNEGGTLFSLEGSESLSSFAKDQIERYCENPSELSTGPFSKSLPELLKRQSSFSMVFIDGHHTEEAAKNYFYLLRNHISHPSVVIFDDVEPWSPVKKAWNSIIDQERSKSSNFDAIYLFKKGLVYFH